MSSDDSCWVCKFWSGWPGKVNMNSNRVMSFEYTVSLKLSKYNIIYLFIAPRLGLCSRIVLIGGGTLKVSLIVIYEGDIIRSTKAYKFMKNTGHRFFCKMSGSNARFVRLNWVQYYQTYDGTRTNPSPEHPRNESQWWSCAKLKETYQST